MGRTIRRNDHYLLDPRVFELDYLGLTEATGWEIFAGLRGQRRLVFRKRGFEFDSLLGEIREESWIGPHIFGCDCEKARTLSLPDCAYYPSAIQSAGRLKS